MGSSLPVPVIPHRSKKRKKAQTKYTMARDATVRLEPPGLLLARLGGRWPKWAAVRRMLGSGGDGIIVVVVRSLFIINC